ncbi:MAG: type II toxin-antitoxin system HicA family toxin [Blastocatellia bacterium]
MAGREKLLEKAHNSPDGLRFEELCRLAEFHGFQFDRQTGSHKIFVHAESGKVLNFQDKNGKAKAYQVRQFLRAVEEIYGSKE